VSAGNAAGLRAFTPPIVVLSLVAGAGSALTFWAQSQVGAIKGGLTLLPALNLASEAMQAYVGKAFVPAYMSVSYSWSSFPFTALRHDFTGAGAKIASDFRWAAEICAGAGRRHLPVSASWRQAVLYAANPLANLETGEIRHNAVGRRVV
jgi:hypothetical protein